MNEWDFLKIRQMGTVITGKTPSKNAPSEWGEDYNFVTPSDYRNYFKYARTSSRKLSELGFNSHKKRLIPKNSVLVTCIGSDMGKTVLNSSDCFTNQQINSLIPNNSVIDYDFAYYLFKNNEAVFKSLGSDGTAVPILNKSDFENIDFLIPDLPEQKAIASVLSSLDDKIDLLHHQNKTLELMAETMFRQWFILDETGASVNLEQIIDFNPKRTLTKSQDATYLDMAGLSTDIFRATGYYKRPFSSGTKFTKRDTLLARITPCLENGKAAYVDFLDNNETGWGSTEFIVMRPKKEIHPMISYIMCRNPDFKEYAESCMEGSTGRQRVNLDHLKKFNVNLPTEASLRIINELLDSFESKLINNSKQIDSLEKLRDTLLPKLMSGEVRVQYAEEAIASVA